MFVAIHLKEVLKVYSPIYITTFLTRWEFYSALLNLQIDVNLFLQLKLLIV